MSIQFKNLFFIARIVQSNLHGFYKYLRFIDIRKIPHYLK